MPRRIQGPKPKVKNPGKLLMRLLSYIFKNYGFACFIVLICMFVNVFSSVQGTLFMQTLIDDYIIPLTRQASPDFTNLAHRQRLWFMSHRELYAICVTICSHIWKAFRSVTLTAIRMVILCQPTRMISILSAR